MHRLTILIVVAVLALPVATAAPIATVSYTPSGIVVGPADPYYIRVTVSEPTPPQREPADRGDCAYDKRSNSTMEAIMRLRWSMFPITTEHFRWIPKCIELPLASDATSAGYASYDVEHGHYFIQSPTGSPLGPTHYPMGFGGGLGAGIETDCDTCPPPP